MVMWSQLQWLKSAGPMNDMYVFAPTKRSHSKQDREEVRPATKVIPYE